MLFFISWLKWYYAIFFLACLVLPLFIFNYKLNKSGLKKFFKYFIVFTIFLVLLGYGEVFLQTHDWDKHNAIFSHLFYNKNKPVYIEYKGLKYFLDYGLGFYIVPSWIASFFNNYYILRWLILINSAFGCVLIGLWITRLFKLSIWLILITFILGNFKFIDPYLYFKSIGIVGFDAFNYIAQIQILEQIDRVLQHTIPICLIFLLIYNNIISNYKNNIYVFYLMTLGFFWSPFCLFPIIPILIFNKFSFNELTIRIIYSGIIPIIVVLSFLFFYYNAHCNFGKLNFWIGSKKYLIFRFIILNLYYSINLLFIYFINKKINFINSIDKKIVILLIIFSELYFHISYGFYNDLWLKSYFLIFIFINILTLKAVQVIWIKATKFTKIILVSSIVTFSFFSLSLLFFKSSAFFLKSPILKEYNQILLKKNERISLEKALYNQSMKEKFPFILQYLGIPNKISCELMKSDE